jgi:multiple sugar transport system substrate-binding protein
VRLVAALVGAGLLLVGCTGASGAPDPVTLRVVLADDWASAPLVGEVVDAFEREHPGVRVQIHGSPFSQIPEVVAAAGELGQPYDLAHWHAFAAAAAGLAEPVDDLWDAAGLEPGGFLPGAVIDVTWDGRRYGLPLDVNALVLLANGDLLEAAGLTSDDLRGIDTFAERAAELAALPDTDHALVVTGSSWAAYGWIVAAGGQLVELAPDGTAALDDEGLPTFTFEDPATVAALEALVELVRSGSAPPPLAPDLAISAVAPFADGRAALHTSGSWDLPITRRAMELDAEVDEVLVLPLPQAEPARPRTVLGGSSLFLPVGGDHRELAFALSRTLTEREIGVALAETEGRLPARRDAYDDPLFRSSPDLAAFVTQLDHAMVMPLIAFPEVSIAFVDGLEAVFAQRSTPAEAMADVQAVADRWREGR